MATRQNAQAPAATPPEAHPRLAAADISKFRGYSENDVLQWLRNYEGICESCGLDPALSFRNFALQSATDVLIRQRASFAKGAWDTLRTLIRTTFFTQESPVVRMTRLEERRQGPGEDVASFAAEITRLSEAAEVSETQLTTYFVRGLNDEVAESLLPLSFDSFKAALDSAKRVEANLKIRVARQRLWQHHRYRPQLSRFQYPS